MVQFQSMFTLRKTQNILFSKFFYVLPSSGISTCGWPEGAVMPPTLGAALLCSSRAGSDM